MLILKASLDLKSSSEPNGEWIRIFERFRSHYQYHDYAIQRKAVAAPKNSELSETFLEAFRRLGKANSANTSSASSPSSHLHDRMDGIERNFIVHQARGSSALLSLMRKLYYLKVISTNYSRYVFGLSYIFHTLALWYGIIICTLIWVYWLKYWNVFPQRISVLT